jgi:hypothetical protein
MNFSRPEDTTNDCLTMNIKRNVIAKGNGEYSVVELMIWKEHYIMDFTSHIHILHAL